MKRINCLISLIEPCKNVIDVGSDHAYLAVKLLTQKTAECVVNVDINKQPLQQGITNLSKYNLLDKTINIQNNGLAQLENHPSLKTMQFDYLVISGLGSHVIIDILAANKLTVKYFVLQTNKNELLLRTWLYKQHYTIVKELFVQDNKINYPIFLVIKNESIRWVSYKTKLLGKKHNIADVSSYLTFLQDKQNYLENENINAKIKQARNLKLIKQRIKWCMHQLH